MTTFASIDPWLKGLVDAEKLPNGEITIYRQGAIAHYARFGIMDMENRRPLVEDAIFRIYSMTKPMIAVAVMQLVEDGKLDLNDPASDYIPSFADQQVIVFENGEDVGRDPTDRPVTLHHLMSHTAGLTYGGDEHPPVSTGYRAAGIDFSKAYADLAEMTGRVGEQPLYYQPGSRWIYSVANDVLGRVIEVASGMALDTFIQTRILGPLGMSDTTFHLREGDTARFVDNFGYGPDGRLEDRSAGSFDRFRRGGTLLSGGSALLSTSNDYMKFARMMLNKGELDGTRILEAASVEKMTTNQLPGDLPFMGCAVHGKMDMTGIGYGYGVSVTVDQDRARVGCSNGDYGWGGVANTYFWVDPTEQMIVLFMSQLFPAHDMPIRTDLRNLVYGAIR